MIGSIWFRGKRNTYLKLFFSLTVTLAFWVLFNGINLLMEQTIYERAYPFVMIIACVAPYLLLAYILYLTENRFAKKRWIPWVLTVPPAIDIALLMTNPWHKEYITGFDGFFPIGGKLANIHFIIGYLPVLLTLAVLIKFIILNVKKETKTVYIGLGILIPTILNVLYTFNIVNVGFDVTPYSFLFMFAMFMVYSTQLKLFDIKGPAIANMFTSLSDAALVVDNAGRIAAANPAFVSAFPDFEIHIDKTQAQCVAAFLESIAVSQAPENVLADFCSPVTDIQHAEITVLAGGERRDYSLSKNIIAERRQFLGYVVLLADISKYRQMIDEINEKNIELAKLKSVAESASNAKGDFLSRMSHEIRTPLNAVMGMARIAQKTATDEKTISSINEITAASAHLLGILNDILDMAKIESGKFDIVHEPFKLDVALEEAIKIISQRCRERDILFRTDCGGAKNIDVVGDKLRLKQIILNLLGNASKFTPTGGAIEFSMRVAKETQSQFNIEFTVSDTGIGISQEHLTRLFDSFEQASATISSHYGGTGLGLAISRSLVEKMGGDIAVSSELGKGSVFSFTIWLDKASEIQEQEDAFDLPDLTGRHLLLAEDVEINRLILRELLADTHIEIDEAEDGRQAVDTFAASPIGYYDIILMDIQMPEMNGYEAARSIRALGRKDAAAVPIVALTANAYREDADKSFEAGMNGHLAKPIDLDAVLMTLAEKL